MQSVLEENVVLRIPCTDRHGEETIYQVKLLREFDRVYELSPEKIAELWKEFSQHKVLFSDFTDGKFRPFFAVLMDPRAIWLEVSVEGEDVPVGVMYITSVKPYHEADGHFAFWDSQGRGREPLVLYIAEWLMDRFQLHRINAYVPEYQKGVRRFIERLGFVHEGVKREAVLYKEHRLPLHIYGILRSEVDEQIARIW